MCEGSEKDLYSSQWILASSLVAQTVKNLLAVVMQETQVWSLGQDYPLEKGMATHSSIAWRIPWTGEPGRLQSMQVTKRHGWHVPETQLLGCWLAIQLIQPTLRKLVVFEGGNRQAISVLISPGHNTTHLVPIVILWGVLFYRWINSGTVGLTALPIAHG